MLAPPRVPRIVIAVALLAVCALQAQPVAAQDKSKSQLDDSYFALKLMLGLGGSVSGSNPSVNLAGTTVSGNGSVSTDLNPSFGGGAQYMVPLHRYFALGGLFAVQSWRAKPDTNANSDRNLLLDLSIVPQGKLPLSDAIELYLSIPIGITLDFWNQASNSVTVAGMSVSTEANTAIGYNLSLLFGARFALSHGFGLLAEVGYTRHAFSHSVKGNVLGASAGGVNVDLALEQVALNLGVFF